MSAHRPTPHAAHPSTRRVAHRAAPALVAFAAIATFTACAPESGDDTAVREGATRATNVLLVVVDTLRADRLGCYGAERPTSPRIDAFAAAGTRYANNRSQGPWTLPSMVSLMSGLYVTQETKALPTDRPVLAELVSEAGVETAAFVGNPVAGRARGFDRGFDHYEESADGATRAREWTERFIAWHAARDGGSADDGSSDTGSSGGRPSDGDRGWFAWVHFMDPHHPYLPQPPFDRWARSTRFGEDQVLAPRWRAAAPLVDELNADLPGAADTEFAMRAMGVWRNGYDGEVAAVDAAFGRLIDHLEASGELDDTLVVLAADHGEMLYEYPHYAGDLEATRERHGGLPDGLADFFVVGHRAWFYPELWRTPLVLRGPGVERGAVVDTLSANLDLAPTILRALGAEVPDDLDGFAKGDAAERERDAVFAYGHGSRAMLRSDGLQLVEHRPGRLGRARDGRRLEVFDLGRPERFLRDLVADGAIDPAPLAERLARWSASGRLTPNFRVDASARDALERLGYLEALEEAGAGTGAGAGAATDAR